MSKSQPKWQWVTRLLIGFCFWWWVSGATVQAQSSQIVINEVYPNPEADEEEWVELYNPSEETFNLANWELWDELSIPSKIYAFTSEDELESQAFLVIPLHNKLNNSGDAVVLKDATGQEIDRLTYPSSTKGTSWAKNPNDLAEVWETIPTKGEINSQPPPTPTPTASAIDTNSSSNPNQDQSCPAAANESCESIIPTANLSPPSPAVLGATSDFVYPLTVLSPKLGYDKPEASQDNLAFLEPPALEKGAISVIMGSLFLLIPGWIYVKNRQKNF
ncbi:MAG: lamin tail domain-containing protein [Candidatus Paceibacterota bacterium]